MQLNTKVIYRDHQSFEESETMQVFPTVSWCFSNSFRSLLDLCWLKRIVDVNVTLTSNSSVYFNSHEVKEAHNETRYFQQRITPTLSSRPEKGRTVAMTFVIPRIEPDFLHIGISFEIIRFSFVY